MRTCLYVQTTHGATLGGAARSLLTIVGAMPARGWRPLVAITQGSPLVPLLTEAGVDVIPMPLDEIRGDRPLRSTRALARWIRLLRRLRPDMIHENTFGESLAFWQLPRLLGIPTISHFRFPMRAEDIAYVLRHAAKPEAVIFNGHGIRAQCDEAFSRHGPRIRRLVLHNAVDLDRFAPTPEPPAPPYRIGMIANFAPYKRHSDLLKLAERICARRSDCRFVCIGGDVGGAGLLAETRTRAEALGLGERLAFLGPCEDIAAEIARLHLVVHPAEGEAFGRVVAESLACARPVIASNDGGPAEIIRHGETGLLVPTGDIVGFANALERLLDDVKLRRRFGWAAARDAHARFSIGVHTGRIALLYDEVLTGPAARGRCTMPQ